MIILAGCGRNEIPYKGIDIEERPSTGLKVKKEISVGLDYMVKEEAEIYSDKDEKTAFDKIPKDSVVRVILEEEDGFVYVSLAGQNFYIRADKLKGI